MHVVQLPPYSPELNPTEKLWDVLKEGICNTIYETIADSGIYRHVCTDKASEAAAALSIDTQVSNTTEQSVDLKAVGLDDSGKEIESTQFITAGDAAGISLKPDHTTITADGQDLSFVRVEVVDKSGQVQPKADNTIHFSLSGPGSIAGLGNANVKDPTPYQGTECHVFHGVALVVLRSSHTPGTLELRATADGLTPATTQVVCY